jgi:cytochrome c biogenesis protein
VESQLDRIVAKALGRKPREVAVDAGHRLLVVEKNRYARFGPYLAHVSILLILLGTLWGSLQGFKGALQLTEGERSSEVWLRTGAKKVPLGFEIRCDRFVIDAYPDGTPREYRSEVTLFDGSGERIMNGAIRVNHPLTYRGITFYQSTYGSIPELTLQIRDQESSEESVVKAELNAPFLLPGGSQGDRAMVVAFQSNLQIPEEMARITSFPRRNLGPAARVVMFNKKGFEEPFWVFKDLPDMGQEKERPHQIVLKDFRLISYTGLQVAKDPGTPLVWIGCTLLVIGFVMALLMDHEIVWVKGEDVGKDEYVIHMAGRAVRHPGVYATRFERQKLRLERGLSQWLNT